MPTYEYQCEACDHNFDEFQSMKEKPLKKCPKCGKPRLRRVFGAGAAIIFKGSGFYQTDYRSESYKQAAKAEKESSTAASANGDSAPAAKDGATGNTAASGRKGAGSAAKSAKSVT